MKKSDAPVVRCQYAGNGESLARLLEESFRLYVARRPAAAQALTEPRRQ